MADITTKVAQIRAAVLGIDVRENIALGIEGINAEAESTTTQQASLQATFNDLVINAGSSNAEIVVARGGAVDLGARLDADESDLLSYKADTATKEKELRSNPLNPKGAMVTFIDDNGDKAFLTTWKPIADAKGIKMGVAVLTGSVGTSNYMSLTELQTLQTEGFEMYSHSVTHPNNWSILTTQQVHDECKNSQDYLVANGLTSGKDTLVYSSGLAKDNVIVKDIVRQYYDYALGVWTVNDDYHNTTPVDNWCMIRANGDDLTLTEMQTALDAAILSGGWLVFFTHSTNFVAGSAEKHSAFIDYCVAQGVPILPFTEAERHKGNIIAQGDKSLPKNKTFVSKDGNSDISLVSGVEFLVDTTMDSLLSTYKNSYMTVKRIPGASDTLLSIGGTLITYNFSSVSAYAFQKFYPYSKKQVYKRRWTGTAWDTWYAIGQVDIGARNSGATILSDALTTYKAYMETTFAMDGDSSTPSGGAGTYKVFRFGTSDDAFGYAEFKPYSNNSLYSRRWASDVWQPWVKISSGEAHTTATRPSNLTVGATIFDTTLSKPIWLKTVPSTWVDATGTTV